MCLRKLKNIFLIKLLTQLHLSYAKVITGASGGKQISPEVLPEA